MSKIDRNGRGRNTSVPKTKTLTKTEAPETKALTNTEVPLEEKTLEQQRKRARLEKCIDDLDRERLRLWRKLWGRVPRSKRLG
jgi:hypothetical protein